MAKGLRSKRMRRNRTALRKAIIEPLTDRRLKKTTTALAEQIKNVKGSSIKSLAKKLGRGDGEEDEEDMDVSSEEEEEEEVDERGRSTAQRSVRSSSKPPQDDADDVTHYAPVPKRKSTFKFAHP